MEVGHQCVEVWLSDCPCWREDNTPYLTFLTITSGQVLINPCLKSKMERSTSIRQLSRPCWDPGTWGTQTWDQSQVWRPRPLQTQRWTSRKYQALILTSQENFDLFKLKVRYLVFRLTFHSIVVQTVVVCETKSCHFQLWGEVFLLMMQQWAMYCVTWCSNNQNKLKQRGIYQTWSSRHYSHSDILIDTRPVWPQVETIDDLIESAVTWDCDDPGISRQPGWSRSVVGDVTAPWYVQVPRHLHGLASPLRDDNFKISLHSRQHLVHLAPYVLYSS